MSCGQQITIKRPNHQHLHTDITDFDTAVQNIIDSGGIGSTVLNSNSAYWNSVFNTVCALSADWESGGVIDLTVLSANSACWMAACSGNVVYQANSAFYNSVYTSVNTNSTYWNQVYNYYNSVSANINSVFSLSSNWQNTYTTVNSNSSEWNYQGTDVKLLTSNWENISTVVKTNSAQWAVDMDDAAVNTYVQTTSANINSVYTTVNSNSSEWDLTYTNFSSQSANNLDVYTTVNSNSADWNYQGTDIRALTSNWENTYTNFSSQSANNTSVYSAVNANSAANWNYQGTDVKTLTSNWENTYTGFSTQSADNLVLKTIVQTNSSAWALSGISTGYYPSTGGILEGDLITSSIISANSAIFNAIKFNTDTSVDWEEGRVFYDTVEHTLSYYNDDVSMTVNIGQEQIVRVYNGESTQIDNGKVVYLSGSHGNKPQVFLANSSYLNANTDKIIGIATTNIPSTGNKIGYVTTQGIVHNIFVGSTVYTEGDNIFLTTDGNFSKIEPEKPNHIIDLGIVTNVTGGGSDYYIDVLVNINKRSTLVDLHDVKTVSLSTNDLLVYNIASGGYWENKSANNWDATYTNFSAQSANNLSVYTNVNANSATTWNYQGTDVKSLTSNWQDTYTNFSGQSANNLDVYTNVNVNSAAWSMAPTGDPISLITSIWS